MLATTQIKLVWVPVGQTFLRAGFGRLPDSSPPLVLTHFPPFPGEDTGSVRRMEGPVTRAGLSHAPGQVSSGPPQWAEEGRS